MKAEFPLHEMTQESSRRRGKSCLMVVVVVVMMMMFVMMMVFVSLDHRKHEAGVLLAVRRWRGLF